MQLEGEQIGSYRLLRLIGGGGMGDVYLAEDVRVNRQVAMKVIQTATTYADGGTGQDTLRLFEREVKAVANLDHPHILPFFDCGGGAIHGMGITYMVMPYRWEGSLLSWLRQHSPSKALAPEDVAHFLRQAADALQYAHDQGIIHRDVKPSNFLIRENKENPNGPDLLLADFGLAKFNTLTSAISRGNYGTPIYMAPEHWDGRPVPATDQYALAVMAYELLTGRPPFLGSHQQVMYQHLEVQPPLPSKLNPRVAKGIDAVLLRALAKRAADRYPSVSAFAQAFEQACMGGDVKGAAQLLADEHPAHRAQALRVHHARTEPEKASSLGVVDTGVMNHAHTKEEGLKPQLPDGEHALGGRDRGTMPSTVSTGEMERGTFASLPGEGESLLHVGEELAPGRRKRGSRQSSAPGDGKMGMLRGRERSTSTTMLLIGLLLVFVTLGGAIFAYVGANGETRAPTINAEATATAQASGRGIMNDAPTTPTINQGVPSTPFATPASTASLLQRNPYPLMGTLALYDPLQDNMKGNNWDEVTNGAGSCQFTNGGYQVRVSAEATRYLCAEEKTSFSNFVFQVQMTIVAGSYGGIVFRVDTTHTKFYFFRIGTDGSYELVSLAGDASGNKVLKSGTSAALKTGLNEANILAVVASGSNLDLYVNQQHIAFMSDRSLSEGQLGFCAEDVGNESDVVFSDVSVWTL